MLAAGSEIGQGKVHFLEPDLRIAQAAAYAAVECIQFDGAHFRRDNRRERRPRLRSATSLIFCSAVFWRSE
jgi:hypothetical protein